MKNSNFFIVFVLSIFVSGCIPTEDETSGKDTKFLILHNNSAGKLSTGAYLSQLTVKKGEPQFERLNEIYPASNLNTNVDISNDRVVIGLHTDFNVPGTVRQTNGAWFDIATRNWEQLPLLAPGKDRYNYFNVVTGKVSESGHIFYLSSSNVISYHDQYLASLVRYNPKTKELLQATDPSGFAKSQPEKGWDTEAAQFKYQFYPSNDGRYVYGVVDAFGVDGGMLHWDYKILFKYDFNTDTYTRLGDSEDRDVIILGITADKNYVAYTSLISNKYYNKLVNTATNVVTTHSIQGGQGFANTSRWNNTGYCSGETNNTIGIYNLVGNTSHNIKTTSRPYYAQFGADGNTIYFMYESGAKKYLCKTSEITASATIDTVCILSADVIDFIVIK